MTKGPNTPDANVVEERLRTGRISVLQKEAASLETRIKSLREEMAELNLHTPVLHENVNTHKVKADRFEGASDEKNRLIDQLRQNLTELEQ